MIIVDKAVSYILGQPDGKILPYHWLRLRADCFGSALD